MEVRKAIVLDMDNTLICGVSNESNGYTMFLRPGIDEVIKKLKDAKEKGVDIILCTTALDVWVERFLDLKPEFRELFTKIYSRNNERDWRDFDYQEFPIEDIMNMRMNKSAKPVTAWGYNSILFIDDAESAEGEVKRLYADCIADKIKIRDMIRAFKDYLAYDRDVEELVNANDKDNLAKVIEALPEDIKSKLPSKRVDITFFKIPFYNIDASMISQIINLINGPSIAPETQKKIQEIIKHANEEPGCRMMCDVIDKFMEKEFAPGLTMPENNYEQEIDCYTDKKWELEESLPDSEYNFPEKICKYMAQDREAPYLGILHKEMSICDVANSLIRIPGVVEMIGNGEDVRSGEEQNVWQAGEEI